MDVRWIKWVFKGTCAVLMCVTGHLVPGQTLFTEEGQVFAIGQGVPAFSRLGIDPANGAVRMVEIHPDIGFTLDAIGYRRTDRLIYGIRGSDKHLCRMGAEGFIEDLGDINLDIQQDYLAGDVAPDGRTYVTIGSLNGSDRQLISVDLESPGYPYSVVLVPGISHLLDIAFDPTAPGILYGYDEQLRTILKISLSTFGFIDIAVLPPGLKVQSVYFDAFGSLCALGTSNGGVAGALFSVDKSSGAIDIVSTGPVHRVTDLAAIPYSVEMQNTPSVRIAFPCNEIEYTFVIANRTNDLQEHIHFETRLPPGFQYQDLDINAFGGNVSEVDGVLHISEMRVPVGIQLLRFTVKVGDIPEGFKRMQGQLSNLPARYGSLVVSDDPVTPQFEDSTRVQVSRLDQDSITFNRFLCLGDSVVLDGSSYGSQLEWFNGAVGTTLTVYSGGQYAANIVGGCQSTIIVFNVTAATCPFTIEVDHEMQPPEIFPCSEMIFSFRIENDSGVERDNLTFVDSLPAGITFVRIESNPFGGVLNTQVLPDVIHITGMKVPLGAGRVDLRVAVSNLPPGEYRNQAVLSNLPTELGPIRRSDDPRTPPLDSTVLVVLGVETDSLYVDEILCAGSTITLDGSLYGTDHHWYDGATTPMTDVRDPGVYELIVFDGCEPTYIFFQVSRGEQIEVAFDSSLYHLGLGDTLTLSPAILNTGSYLNLSWSGSEALTLSCDTCFATNVFPLFDAEYWLHAQNEHCRDSARVRVTVDKTRRLFVPNIFTPNYDGINDVLFLSSPDFGVIETFQIIDRWGKLLYEAHGDDVNTVSSGWEGLSGGRLAPSGTYLWHARIRFLDGVVQSFAGTTALLR